MDKKRSAKSAPASSGAGTPDVPKQPPHRLSDHLASRRAVKEVLESQQVVIAKKFHDVGRINYSVLVRDECYDVNERELALL